MGAPLGNQNARKGKWSEAVSRAAELEDPASRKRFLDAIAAKLIEKAVDGDITAIKEFGDRIDGKSPQAVTLGNEAGETFVVTWKTDDGNG